ncbi:hypothetical protein L596_023550 [Steinernema carpocapsae]|uniref:Uncharacterized protein n=1 Tax=Steinernema carpocapsae TaxID=34508 RepID=A0A4U5MDZ5_STECR|nr:hypothetical protein L596_023550 [Steinernema carpocapsae]
MHEFIQKAIHLIVVLQTLRPDVSVYPNAYLRIASSRMGIGSLCLQSSSSLFSSSPSSPQNSRTKSGKPSKAENRVAHRNRSLHESEKPALHKKLQALRSKIEAKIAKLQEGAQVFLEGIKAFTNVLVSGQLAEDQTKQQIGKLVFRFKALSESDKKTIFEIFPNLKKFSEEPKFKTLLALQPAAANDIGAVGLELN